MAIYPKYDRGTYITRELYRKVCETGDLRHVWAHANAQKWNVDYDLYLEKCNSLCSCCGSKLDYGIGKNNNGKLDENTPSTDHKIPRSKGGTDAINNLWIICNKCNTLKNNSTFEDIKRYENIIKVLKEHKTI
jgi:5-methylcytosine-specific restriction endonuclease McrA